MEASNKIKLDSACQHALTFTFLRVCIRIFHPTQETNIATPAMQFLVEKAVGKDTLALRVNYVIFYGFLRGFLRGFYGFSTPMGSFTGFLRPKTWFLNMSSKIEQTVTKCMWHPC